MDRPVEGEDWESQGWIRIIEFLYEDDVTSEENMIRVPEEISKNGWESYESLGPNSPLLSETGLSEEQAIFELNFLRKQNLVDLLQPFEDKHFGVNRLTDKGFRVAHDLQRSEREEQWRNQNSMINLILTVATVVLSATAIVQGILAYLGTSGDAQTIIVSIYAVTALILLLLLIGRRGSKGPNIWG